MAVTLDDTHSGTASVLDAVRELAPVIAARAGEIEEARRVPLDLVGELRDAGCFRMLLPRSHGGLGLDLVGAMDVFGELSRADASVAWIIGIGSAAWMDLTGLPRETFDGVFHEGSRSVVGGVFAPSGIAVPVDGGYRVTGRWAFASGCEHCDWLYGNCIEEGASGEAGPPLRIALMPAADVEIHDTWSVSGLRGTGSHHISVDDVFVPAERTLAVMADEPCLDDPWVHIPLPSPYALLMASVAVGAGQGALDDVLALAVAKQPLFSGTSLAGNPLFQHQLGRASAQLAAARALLHAEAADAWDEAVAGRPFTPDRRARIRAAATWATTTAAEVVDAAYTAGGGSSLYSSSPLQRRLRDVHALTQHFLVKPDTLTTAGAVLAGQEVDITFL